MNTIIKSSNGISLVPIESRLLTDREILKKITEVFRDD